MRESNSQETVEFGTLPIEWHIVPLGELVSAVEYGSSAKSSKEGRVPVLRMGNLAGGKICWKDLVYTDGQTEIDKYRLHRGDVLFNRTNTIDLVGKTSIFDSDRESIFAGYLIRVVVDNKKLNASFLNYILNTEYARKHSQKILSIAVGQANINGQKLRTYPIPLPPTIAEQEAIAEALGDADALIESLEQLVAKKRHLKQAAMEELLTGKTRLPGFAAGGTNHESTLIGSVPSDWELSTVGTEFDIQLGKMLDVEKNSGVLKPYLGNRNVQWGWINTSNLSMMAMGAADLTKFRLQYGDLLVCEGGEVGRAAVWHSPIAECYFQKAIHRLRAKKGYASELMIAYLHKWSGEGRLANFVTQTSIAHLPKDKFITIPLPKPSAAEQSAIAEILSDMDAEIEALEVRLAKARLIKQGMMQELLTGRIRLV